MTDSTGLPSFEIKEGELLVDVLVRMGLARSKREARYFIRSGAIRMNQEVQNGVQADEAPEGE